MCAGLQELNTRSVRRRDAASDYAGLYCQSWDSGRVERPQKALEWVQKGFWNTIPMARTISGWSERRDLMNEVLQNTAKT
jgi:hypothetical protein